MSKQLLVLYDARARIANCTDDATVLATAHNPKQAQEASEDYRETDSIWTRYREKGTELVGKVLLPYMCLKTLRAKGQ